MHPHLNAAGQAVWPALAAGVDVAGGRMVSGARAVACGRSARLHNEWNVELIWAEGYPERLRELLACDAVIALDGGVGTLSELAVAWSAAQTESGGPLLVAIGGRWARLLGALAEDLVVSPDDVRLVHVVPSASAAVEIVLHPPERGAGRAKGLMWAQRICNHFAH